MKLRTQVGIMLITVLGCLVAVITLVQMRVIYPSYVQLEASLATTDVDRCVQAIDREVEYVKNFAIDWGVWNDMYEFAHDGNAAFRETNLDNVEYFQNLNVPFMCICDADGKVIYRHLNDPETFEPIELAAIPGHVMPMSHSLMRPPSEIEVYGVLLTERAPMLFASRAILHSDESGPAYGRFIVGRFLDESAISKLSEQTSVHFELWPSNQALPEDIATQLAGLQARPGEAIVQAVDAASLVAMRVVPTINPTESIVLRATILREVTAQGAKTIGFGMASLFLAATCVLLTLVYMLQRRVVSPIETLKDHVTSVSVSGDLSARIGMHRTDEVGMLADEFDRMMGRLADSQESLAKACRQAGMADVAAGVLHNVGNAMTNATVTVSELQRCIEQSRSAGLGKAAALVREHEHDLSSFFAQDARGRQLPAYLCKLSDSLNEEQQRLADHTRRLQASLDHISEIIRAQQGLADAPNIVEVTRLSHVMEQALTLVRPSYQRHEVTLRSDVEQDLVIRIDRTRLQQVLVNLLTNALQAVKPVGPAHRVVEVRAGAADDDAFWIEVRDHGVGFDPAANERLFAQGFTTREGGHGMGLHFCAVAARQMFGSISAQSDGPGRGATFRVELPCTPTEVRVAA